MDNSSVIWKRPDGFHGANPSDFMVVDIGSESRLWLHKSDFENFPFRISGSWSGEKDSKKLNSLVNLLAKEKKDWLNFLSQSYGNSSDESKSLYFENLKAWLLSLSKQIKGDKWEELIVKKTFLVLDETLEKYKKDFLS